MAYVFTDDVFGLQAVATTDTVQNHPLGLVARAADGTYGGGEFIYLKGVASTVAGDIVSYDCYNGTTTRWAGTANTGQPLAVAMSANVALQYGWYQIGGAVPVNISGTVAAGDKMFWQATATASSSAVAGKQVLGAIAVTANAVPSAGKAVYQISRPCVQSQIT